MTHGKPMTPERWNTLLHAHLDGVLSAADEAEFAGEVARNPEAAAELASFTRLAAVSLTARTAPPPGFAADVMAAVGRSADEEPGRLRPVEPGRMEPAAGPLARFVRSFFPGPEAWRPAFGGALVVAAIALLLAALVTGPARDTVAPEAPSLVVHDFRLTAPEASRVCLVGSFNGWKVCEAPLVHDPETGTWSLRIELPRGRHEYMFVIDDADWVTDPGADIKVDDGFGNENAVVFI